jgi:hypothetical protein
MKRSYRTYIPGILVTLLIIGIIALCGFAIYTAVTEPTYYTTTVSGTCRDGYAFDGSKRQIDHYMPGSTLANVSCREHNGVQSFRPEYSYES